MTDTRKWTLLSALLIVAIVVSGWFLLISPKRSDAAAISEQTIGQDEANARLTQQIAVLKAQMEELPAQRARLAAIRTNIPDNPALPRLIRDLTAAGRKTGVSLDSLAPAQPVAMVAAAPVAVVDPAAAGATPADGTDPAAAPVAPVAAPAATLYQVPLTLQVSGSYFELEQFVNKLEGFRRSLLISGFTVGEPSREGADAEDLGISIQARVFLSPAVAPAAVVPVAVTPAPAEGSGTAPTASSDAQ